MCVYASRRVTCLHTHVHGWTAAACVFTCIVMHILCMLTVNALCLWQCFADKHCKCASELLALRTALQLLLEHACDTTAHLCAPHACALVCTGICKHVTSIRRHTYTYTRMRT